ncbi:MAG TPA: choice-of-anchor Q domain-containing protein [Fimbriiglobus sp.]|nr:choice-of-anchor Q domain-containing protein [Fimbriiglobus sp.]
MTRSARKESLPRSARLPLRLESLEDRTTPATFTVTNLSDAGAGSLRNAIDLANITTGADVIDFAPAIRGETVKLTTFFNPPNSATVLGATFNPAGPTGLIVFDDVTIQGTGETITRTASESFRLFQVANTGKLTLQNLTLTNGHAIGGMGDSGGGGAAGLGGAIYNQGSLTITGCFLSGNTAEGNSGLDSIAPTVTGRGGGGLGGGLAGVNGGGPNGGLAVGPGSPRAVGFGGGGHGGNFGVGNEPESGGFGGGGGGGFAGFDGGGNGGFGGGGGAGLAAAAGKGFGGFGGGNGSASPIGNGGGGAGMGGAVFNQGGTVTIANSTLLDNTAVGGIGDGDSQQGGGFGGGVFNLNGSLTLTNATFSNNRVSNGVFGAKNVAEGGAVYNLSLNVGTVTPTQTATVTVANTILADSRVGLGSTDRTPDVVNNQVNGTATIIATGPNLITAAVVNTGGAVSGTPFTVAFPNYDLLNTDDGGLTKTLSLNAGSPAIDAGSNAAATGLATDQRGPGFVRISNGVVDIGAFEVQVPVVVDPATLPNGVQGIAYSQTLTVSGPVGPFTFTVTAGTPPPGITLSNTGTLSGTPTQAGTFAFSVTATNATAEAGSRAYTLTIGPPPPAQPAAVGGLLDGTARRLNPAGGKYQLGDTLNFFPGLGVNVRVATADVTGDGVPDYVGGTGPGSVTRVAVRDGATGTEVVSWQPFESAFTGGVFVAAQDMDGDGKAEVVVSPDQGGGPVAAVFAGAMLAAGTGGDAAQIVRYFGIDDPGFRGGARPALGDVTGDGKADLIVSAGFLGGPRITIWDGASVLAGTPAQRLNFFAFENTLRNGAFVAAGDVTGDGVADVAFGGGPGGAPRVRLFDGKALLAAGSFTNLDEVGTAQKANFFAGDSSLRGGVRLALLDADGGGRADLITGSGEGEPSRVRVYLSGNLLANANPTADQDLDPFAGAVLAGGVFVG